MKSWTKTILGIGVSCSLLGAALVGYVSQLVDFLI